MMKDPNDCLRAGINLRELADQAKPWTPNGEPKQITASWRAYTVTAADLAVMEFPPINYVVPLHPGRTAEDREELDGA